MSLAIATLALLCMPAAGSGDDRVPCCGGNGCCRGGRAEEPGPRHPGPARVMPGRGGMSDREHQAIFGLVAGHASIDRTVEEIPGGVRTRTTTTDPGLVRTLRTHVRQMETRLELGRPVRMWDPVFRDVFEHADEIAVVVKEVEGGVEVTETSENPRVVPMIRAHAAKVSDFASRGPAAVRPPWAGGGRGRLAPGR